eukprot:COSAG06_NODE_3698_length_4997_cov_1.758677_5_plen_64_part_00
MISYRCGANDKHLGNVFSNYNDTQWTAYGSVYTNNLQVPCPPSPPPPPPQPLLTSAAAAETGV